MRNKRRQKNQKSRKANWKRVARQRYVGSGRSFGRLLFVAVRQSVPAATERYGLYVLRRNGTPGPAVPVTIGTGLLHLRKLFLRMRVPDMSRSCVAIQGRLISPREK